MQFGQSPWEQAGASVNNLGNSMMRVALAHQAARQRQTQFAAQMAMREAQMRMMHQRAAGANAKAMEDAAGSRMEREAGESLAKHMGQLPKAERLATKFNNPELVAMVVNRLMQDQSRLASRNPGNIATQVPQIMAMRDPRQRAMLAHDTPMTQTITPGATLFNNATGKPEFTAPMSNFQNRNLQLRDQANKIRAAGVLDNPFIDDSVRSLVNNVLEAQGSDGEPISAAAPVSDTVRVINPQGRKVRIPADQLNEALSNGYQLNQ